jgi:hypothetical protein
MTDALNQTLKLEVVKEVGGPPGRMQEVTTAPAGTPPLATKRRRVEQSVCCMCGNPGNLRRDCRERLHEKTDQSSGATRDQPLSSSASPYFRLNILAKGLMIAWSLRPGYRRNHSKSPYTLGRL